MEEKGSFTKHIKSVLTSYMYFRFKTAIFFFWGGGIEFVMVCISIAFIYAIFSSALYI